MTEVQKGEETDKGAKNFFEEKWLKTGLTWERKQNSRYKKTREFQKRGSQINNK